MAVIELEQRDPEAPDALPAPPRPAKLSAVARALLDDNILSPATPLTEEPGGSEAPPDSDQDADAPESETLPAEEDVDRYVRAPVLKPEPPADAAPEERDSASTRGAGEDPGRRGEDPGAASTTRGDAPRVSPSGTTQTTQTTPSAPDRRVDPQASVLAPDSPRPGSAPSVTPSPLPPAASPFREEAVGVPEISRHAPEMLSHSTFADTSPSPAPGPDVDPRPAVRTGSEHSARARQSTAVERASWASEFAATEYVTGEAAASEPSYEAHDAAIGYAVGAERADRVEGGLDSYDEGEVWLEAAGEDTETGLWAHPGTGAPAGAAAGRMVRPEFVYYEEESYEVEHEEVEDDDVDPDEEEDEDEGFSLDPERSLIEDPRRRGFFHHGSSDDHHLRRRRQRDRDPERSTATAYATAALSAFAGLALFVVLLVVIAIVAGAAAIVKQDQQQHQPGKPIPIPAPHPTKHPGTKPPVLVPRKSPLPWWWPIPIIPIIPIVPVPVPVPVVPPGAPVPLPPGPPVPLPRRPPDNRPPGKPKGPTGPGRQNPKRKRRTPAPQPAWERLPLCKNTYVLMPGDIPIPFPADNLAGMDASQLGIPGVCRPDNGGPPAGVGGSSPAGTISYVKPNGAHRTQVTVAAASPVASGGVTLDAAVSPSGSASVGQGSRVGVGSAVSISGGGVELASAGASSGSGLLTSGQQEFGARLVADTGLNEQVVSAWMYAEENGSFAQSYQAANDNDWLNVGHTDSGNFGTGDSIWSNPLTAADATAGWMKGQAIPGFGTASAGIRSILGTVGQPPQVQIAALQNSGWASSGYPDLPLDYELFTGVTLPSVGAGSVPTAASGGGTLTKAELISKLPTVTQAELSKLTPQDLTNALPQLEAALNGTATTSQPLPPGSGPAAAQRMLAAAEAVLHSRYNQGNHDAVSDRPEQINQLGTDCSGFVSYLMGPHGAGLWTQTYATNTMSQAPNLEPGTGTAGHDVTIYNNPLPGNSGHVFIDIEGNWFEDAGATGVVQMHAGEVQTYLQSGLYTQVFHPAGM